MTDFLIELLNTLTPYAVNFPIFLYPMWKTHNSSRRFVSIYLACFTVYAVVALAVARQFVTMNLNTIHTFKLLITLPAYILPLIVFKKRMWQVVFLIATALMYSPFFLGLGNFTAEKLFPENTLLFASLISILVAAVSFPPLLIILRRIYDNPNIYRAESFWRLAWLVPMSFFVIIVAKDSYLSGNDFNAWFVIIRAMAYAISLMLCYLFDVIARQLSQAEEEKLKSEKLTRHNAQLKQMLRDKGGVPGKVTYGALTLDINSGRAFHDDCDLELRQKEFALLLLFVQMNGSPVSSEYIFEKIWNQPLGNDKNALQTAISRLRKKLEPLGHDIYYNRSRGYTLE